ncbi:PiggyBac transposable element-derived protein like [Argiope bruennichi]|uniref:PiggyBac transposable element-derived protein like n=1 Tax=Argiope bruennichi TaxID=94029 RepID=A0A8T0F7K5_ARGBR|nr:PiggyBac transposable element-derived protein like [Argiope bruennichi]
MRSHTNERPFSCSELKTMPSRLVERHFISHIPPNPIKREPRRRCAICCSKTGLDGKRIRKETRMWCEDCNVALCVEPCFKIYHTEKYF